MQFIDGNSIVPYTSASSLTWVGAGLCFTAVASAGSAPQIICAGVDKGLAIGIHTDLKLSSLAGASLTRGATYLVAHGHTVYTGCVLAGAPGGPHLCAFNAISGEVASSWGDANQVALPANALSVVGSTLYFSAKAPADAATGLWTLELGA